MARRARDSDVLRQIAREEPLSATLKAFPGVSREKLVRVLERAADLADLQLGATGSPRGSSNAELPLGSVARLRVYSDGAARGNPGPSGAGAGLVEPRGQVADGS